MARNLSSGPAASGVVNNELLAQLAQYTPRPGIGPGGRFLPQAEIEEIARSRFGARPTGLRNPFPPVAPGTALPPGSTGPTPLALPQGGPRTYSVGAPHGPAGPNPMLGLPPGGPRTYSVGAMHGPPVPPPLTGARGLLNQLMGGRPGQWLNRPGGVANLGLVNRIPGGAATVRQGLYGMAGNIGGGMLESALDEQGMGLLGDIGGSAARFAPLGAGFGPLGVGVAAGLGGLWGGLTGDRGAEPPSAAEQMTADLAGLVPGDQLTAASALYEALSGTLGEEAAFQTAYGQIINDLATGQAANQPAPDVLALQMASQAMMQPIVAQSNQRLADFQARMDQIIPTLPEAYQSAYAASVPEAAMWQGMMMDANQLAAQMAPVADLVRQGQATGGNDYGSMLAQDDLLSQFMGG